MSEKEGNLKNKSSTKHQTSQWMVQTDKSSETLKHSMWKRWTLWHNISFNNEFFNNNDLTTAEIINNTVCFQQFQNLREDFYIWSWCPTPNFVANHVVKTMAAQFPNNRIAATAYFILFCLFRQRVLMFLFFQSSDHFISSFGFLSSQVIFFVFFQFSELFISSFFW